MTIRTCVGILLRFLVLLLTAPPGVFGLSPLVLNQGRTANPNPTPAFRQEELDQMLAPIALYPDALLVQMLMASTYPVEISDADHWVKENRNLRGEEFAAALNLQVWDPSVKSLVNFPSVLTMMAERQDWSQRLGDAFLCQREQVMDTVQKLRAAARSQGQLKSTVQQRIVSKGRVIVIEPVDPHVIYVPVYDPTMVYGSWWYPDYPPYPCHPQDLSISGAAISFGVGIAAGAAWAYAWGGLNWHRHRMTINVYQNLHIHNRFDRRIYVAQIGHGGRGIWQHDPLHRRGVAYKAYGDPHAAGQIGKGTQTGFAKTHDRTEGRSHAMFRAKNSLKTCTRRRNFIQRGGDWFRMGGSNHR